MTEAIQDQIGDILSQLNAIYGKGAVFEVSLRKRKFIQVFPINRHNYAPPQWRQFDYKINKRKNTVMVRALRHQITRKINP
jgi:hypothetical protein